MKKIIEFYELEEYKCFVVSWTYNGRDEDGIWVSKDYEEEFATLEEAEAFRKELTTHSSSSGYSINYLDTHIDYDVKRTRKKPLKITNVLEDLVKLANKEGYVLNYHKKTKCDGCEWHDGLPHSACYSCEED